MKDKSKRLKLDIGLRISDEDARMIAELKAWHEEQTGIPCNQASIIRAALKYFYNAKLGKGKP